MRISNEQSNARAGGLTVIVVSESKDVAHAPTRNHGRDILLVAVVHTEVTHRSELESERNLPNVKCDVN